MSAHQPTQALRNRRLLSGTTALLVVWSLSGAGQAQDLPTGGTGTVGAPTIPVPAPADTNMTVTLNATDTVIDWATFNIATGNTVDFDNNGVVTPMSVLNRVAVGGGQSLIDGTLSSDKNIAVWLLNPNGVMFGSTSTVNTGSFFVSTLNMANTDFTSATYRLRDGINSAGAVDATWIASGDIDFGGTVTAGDLTNPGTVGVAGQIITANGAMTATGGDIALIATRDVTFDFTPGSPLGIEVNAGTTLATAKVTVGATGQLTANSIVLAGAANITDALLGVDSGASLEAVEVDGRIILSVGADATSGTHASLDFTPSGTTSAADIVTAGGLTADGEVIIQAPGKIEVAGSVTADTYTIAGDQDIELNDAGLTGTGTITANNDGSGSEDLTLTYTGAILLADATLNGGTARQSDVNINAANQNVTIGNISAKDLTGLNNQAGNISLGTVSVTDVLSIRSSSGSVSLTGITTDDGGAGSSNATIRAATTLSVNGPVSVDGDYSLTADTGTVTVGGTQGAKGLVAITGVGILGSGSLTSNSDATGTEALTLNSTGTINMTTALNGGTASQSNVTVSAASQNVTLGNITALNLTGLSSQAGNIALGTVVVTGDLNLRSTSGSLSAAAVTADDGVSGGAVSDATLRADTNLTVSGNVSVEGDYSATADTGRVTLGGVQGANGKVTVQGATATFNGLALTANNNDALSTGDAAGALSVTATGGITLTGSTTTLKGGVTSGHFTDVTVDSASGTGDVAIAGNVVKLGGITTTGSIDVAAVANVGGVTATAPDLKATGADTSVTVQAGTTITVGDVEAGDGTGATPPSPQIDLEGTSVTADAVDAKDGNAELHATDGDVTATSVAAKGAVTVQADIVTVLAANIRIDNVTTADGNVALTTSNGDVTGKVSTNRLSATAGGEGSTVTVSASAGKALLGTVIAGTGTAASAVTDQLIVTAEEIDVTSATANDGDVTLTTQVATGTSITVGAALAERHVDIDAKTTADAGNLTSNLGDVTVAAVQTATVSGNVTAGADTGATGNYNVTGSAIQLGANASTRLQRARGLVRIHATADIDGRGTLTLAADSNNSGQEPLLLESDAGKITFASTSLLQGGSSRHSKVGVFMGDATQDLTLGGVQARGLYKLAGTGGAEAFLTNLNHSGNVTLGDTSLRNTLSITTTGTISALSKIFISGTGQGLFLDGAGITANGDLAAQGNVDLNAPAISATNIYSNRNIETSGTSLDADLVQALGDVTDTTSLGSVTAITAGTAAPSPYTADGDVDTGAGGGPVTDCCDATPTAPGLVAGAGDITLTKQTVDVGTLTAARDIIATASTTSVTITSGTAGRDATVTSETFADIGSLTATSRDLKVTAGDAVSVTDGGIDLTTANAGQDITLSARNGDIKVGTVTANRAVLIENTDRGGTTGDIEIATAVRASNSNTVDGNATVKSQDDIRLQEVSAKRGNVEITAAADITGMATTGTPTSIDDYGRGNVTSGVSGNAATKDKTVLVETTAGRVKLAAITAGDGPATASTGVTQITVSGLGVDVTSVNARDGGVELTAADAAQDLSAGTVAAADDIDMESVRNLRANTVTSAAGDIRVTADNGDISGTGGLTTAAAMTASGESKSITVNAVNGTARLGDVTAGTGSPSATVQPDQVKVTAKTVNFGTSKAWAKDGGLTIDATDGDLTLGTGEARANAALTTSDNVRLGALTATEGNAVVEATAGDITGLPLGTTPETFGHADIVAGNDVQVTSGLASHLDAVSAGRNIQVAATGNAEVIGDVTAGSAVSGGGYDVRGQSVTLGKATAGAVSQKATGLVRVAATGGNVTGRGDLTLTSDSDSSAPHGAPVLLEAANGAVAFGTNTTVQGGPNRTGRVGIRVGAGESVTLGNVNARAIDGLGGTVGIETFTAGLATQGDISFGTVSVRNGLSLSTTGGNITTAGITISGASQGAKLTATGVGKDITVGGDVSAQGDIILNAGRNIALADARSHAGNVELTGGGNISGSDLDSAGKVVQTATGAVTFATVTSGVTGSVAPDASDPGAGATPGAAGTLALPTGSAAATPAGDAAPVSVDNHIAIDANAITIGSAIAARNLTLASRTNVRVDTAAATAGALSITADAGDVSGRTISPAGDGRLLDGFGRTQITAQGHGQTVTVTATTGNIQTGTVTAGDGLGAAIGTDQITLTAGKAIDAQLAGGIDAKDGGLTVLAKDGGIATTTIKARKAAKLTTQKIAATNVSLVADSVTTTDGKIELSSAGGIGATSGGRMDMTAGGAGSVITASASGNALFGDVTSGSGTLSPALTADGITVTAADIYVETVLARDGGVTLMATTSDVTADSVTGATYTQVTAQGSVTIDLVKANSQQVDVEAVTGDIILATGDAGTGVTLLANGDVRAGTLTAAAGNASVTATNGDVSGLARTSAATDGRLLTGFERSDLSASGSVTVEGGDVQLGAINAGAALTATASKSIDLADGTSVGASTIEAGQAATIASVESTAASVAVTGASAQVTTAKAKTTLAVEATGGNLELTTGTADGAATLTATGNATITTSLIAGGTASLSAGGAATVARIDSTGADVVVTGASVDVTETAAKTTLAIEATSGDLHLGTGTADGAAALTASGNADVTSLISGAAASIEAGQTVTIASVESTGSDVLVKGQVVDATTAQAVGNLAVEATGGNATLGTGTAGGTGEVKATGDATITTSLITGDTATLTAVGLATAARIDSTGAGVIVTGASADVTQTAAKTTLAVEATGGDLSLGTGTADGAATLTASGNADVTLLISGGMAGVTAGQTATVASVESTGSDISVKGKVANVTAAKAGGKLAVEATGGNATLGTGTAGGTGEVKATGDANVTSLIAGGTATLTAGGAATAERIDSTGAGVIVTGASADVTQTAAKTTLLIEATGGDLDLGTGTADGAATLTASGNADVTSLVSGGNAGVTAGQTATVGSVESTGADIAIKGQVANVAVAKAGGKLAIEATAGNATLGTGTAGGTGDIKATGDAGVTSLIAGGTATLTAGGAATAARIDSTGADVIVKGASAAVTQTAAKTTLAVEATGGDLSLGTGTADGAATLTATGDATITTSLIAGGAATLNAGGAAKAVRIDSTGANVIVKGASAEVTQTAAKTTLAIEATGGDLKLGTGSAITTATLTASGNVDVTSLTSGGTASIDAGQTATIASVESTGADVSVKGKAATVIAAKAAGKLAVEATAGNTTLGSGEAGTTADVKASGNATLQVFLRSGGTATVTAGGAVQAAEVRSMGGDVLVTGTTISSTTANSGGILKLTASAGGVTLGTGTAGGAATLETTGATGDVAVTGGLTAKGATVKSAGNAQLAAITSTGDVGVTAVNAIQTQGISAAGQVVKLDAADADIAGDVTGKTITIAARRSLRLGSNASGSGGFDLSETEVNRLKAAGAGSLVALDAGSNDVAIGDLNWTLTDPGTTAAIFTTARIDVTGRLTTDQSGTASASTAARAVVLGGLSTDPTALASVIRVVATASSGGRIDVGGASLELRGRAIAVGQADGFLDDLGVNAGGTPLDADVVAASYVNQPSSTLYRSRLPYTDPLLVRAGSIKLKYTSFALFQNTGQGVVNKGTSIGTAAVPGTIEIDPVAPPNAFALFGEINEVIGSASALLGQNVIKVGQGTSIQNTRVNGCVVGAATACLSSSLVQPPLSVFDNSTLTILTAAAPDLSFDSVLSSNNEALFSDIAAPASDIAAPASSLSDDANCDPATGQCPAGSEKGTEQ